jgi:RimJ/RimL family protein N-acetyltransferase
VFSQQLGVVAGGAEMINTAFYTGKSVRLAAIDVEKFSQEWVRWGRDSEYMRLQDSEPARLWTAKQVKEFLEKDINSIHFFAIHTLEEDKLIGEIDLAGFNWQARSAWVGIGLGERDYWGKGYGSDAMNLILRYAFHGLNLRRVNLTVFEYNPRGIRSYEKVGFRHEGRSKQWLNRDGKRWDMIYMGILREEWEERQ